MIDTYAVDVARPNERQQLRVGRVEDLRPLGAQCDERAHVEEPSVAAFVERDGPPGEPVVLLLRQSIERVDVTVRPGDDGIECGVDGRDRGATFARLSHRRARVGPPLFGRRDGWPDAQSDQRAPCEGQRGVTDIRASARDERPE